jgi:hypothetical protein
MTNLNRYSIPLVIIVIILVILMQYFSLFSLLKANNKESYDEQVYSYYDQIPEGSIIFLGTSQIKHGVNASLIEENLAESNRTIKVFNLGIPADNPFRRQTELNRIIERKPVLVIEGSSWFSYGYRGQNDNYFLYYIRDHSNDIDPAFKQLYFNDRFFSKNQLQILNGEKGSLLDKLFIYRNSIKENLFDPRNTIFNPKVTIITDYVPLDQRVQFSEKLSADYTTISHSYSPAELEDMMEFDGNNALLFDFFYFYVPPDSIQMESLKYSAGKLNQNNIPLIIVHMPLDPSFSVNIPSETRQKYFSFLNSTGIKYYNYEMKFNSSFMADPVHLNAEGNKAFSEEMAKVILKELDTRAV